MILTRLLPTPAESIDLDAEGSRDRLLELYAPPSPTWTRLNFIATVSGSAAGTDGTSETLTNPADRRLLGVIRQHSDIVLIGAQSVRSEGFQLPRTARLAVVTSSGSLGWSVGKVTGPRGGSVRAPETRGADLGDNRASLSRHAHRLDSPPGRTSK